MASKDYFFTKSLKKSVVLWLFLGGLFSAVIFLAKKLDIAQASYAFPVGAFVLLAFTLSSLNEANNKIKSLEEIQGLSFKEKKRMKGLAEYWVDKILKWQRFSVIVAIVSLCTSVFSFTNLSEKYLLLAYFSFGFVLGMVVTIYFVCNRIKNDVSSFIAKEKSDREDREKAESYNKRIRGE